MKNCIKKILLLAVMLMCAVTASAETTVFDPAVDNAWYGRAVFYGRGLQLKGEEAGECKGNLYVTSEYSYYPGEWGRDHFPIFESSDGGKTWTHISDVKETEFQKFKWKKGEDGKYYEVPEGTEGAERYLGDWWTLLFQPQLFELPEDLGELKKGTVICGGITKGQRNTAIVIYYSTDNLRSWEYLGMVALGGKDVMGIGEAIWEPFFVCENDALYCFFSDERGMTAGGGQRLVYSKSKDGKMWGEPVDVCDFEAENSSYRPGMPVVTRLPDGRWFMVYEGVNMPGGNPIYYKISDDIESWRPNVRADGEMPAPFNGGSPYCVTMPDGTLVVGAHGSHKIAVNTDSMKTESWTVIDANIQSAYSRGLVALESGELLIVSAGGHAEPAPHKLKVSVEKFLIPGEIDLSEAVVTGTTPWGENEPNLDNSAKNVIDGNVETFFDGLADGYFVIDLGEEYIISGIGYQGRKNFGFRLKDSVFYGSVDGQNWEKLYTVTSNNDMMNYSPVKGGSYRYIKYTSDGDNYCNMAEVKLYSEEVMKISINGVVADYKKKPVEENGNLMLPVRLAAEAMGAEVVWSDEEKSVAVELKNKLLKLQIGSDVYFLDGEEKTSYNKSKLVDGITYVSVDIIEAMGGKVMAEGNSIRIMN